MLNLWCYRLDAVELVLQVTLVTSWRLRAVIQSLEWSWRELGYTVFCCLTWSWYVCVDSAMLASAWVAEL